MELADILVAQAINEEINEEILNDEPINSVREDKIFNNSYYNGDNLKDSEEYEFSKKISISSDYSDNYLKDVYEYEEELNASKKEIYIIDKSYLDQIEMEMKTLLI